MESLNKINSLVDSARLNSTRTQPFYCDDDIFALDMQKVVSRKWLLVDHVNRIPEPEPGQFFLYEVGPESIIVIRDNDMKINALFNVCPHRGRRRSQFRAHRRCRKICAGA